MAFGICKVAWEVSGGTSTCAVLILLLCPQILEKQEQCDASVEELVVGLAGMLPIAERVKKAAELPQLQDTVTKMMNLIEDASRFVVEYKSDGGPGRHPCASHETNTDLFDM